MTTLDIAATAPRRRHSLTLIVGLVLVGIHLVVGLLTFVFQFNEFLWPLIVVSTTEMRPITTGLTLFNQEFFTQWNLTATGGLILFLPSFLLFILMQRYFVRSVMMSGLK